MEKINNIIDFLKTKKGKSISFFAFYFVFFIFLGFYINGQDLPTNPNNNEKNEEVIEQSSSYYETKNLENSEYLYKITIQKNMELEVLNGSKSNNDSIKNYEYFELVDLNEVKRIIKNAKFLSKSLYSDNTYKVNYEIKTKDLSQLFNNDNTIDSLNNLVLTVKENNDLIKIDLDFSNYMNSIDNNITSYKVLIEYEY